MTSTRKLAANRTNGRKSRGPRTKEGKEAASRNALQHGLTTINYRNPAFAQQIEEMARELCEGDNSPHLFQHALIIAECEIVLGLVRRERVARIERCRNGEAFALARGDQSLEIARARVRQERLAEAELDRVGIKIEEGMAVVSEELEQDTELHRFPPLEPYALDRDEVEAFCEAIPDLKRLERYERRAWSRQERAIRDLIGMASWDDSLP